MPRNPNPNIHNLAKWHAALSANYDALAKFVEEAEGWHNFHQHTEVQCDEICACIAAGRAALEAARPLIEEGVHAAA